MISEQCLRLKVVSMDFADFISSEMGLNYK